MTLSNNVTKLTKEQFIELLIPTIILPNESKKTPLEAVITEIEDTQENIYKYIREDLDNQFDNDIREYTQLDWHYVQDNTTQLPYFYFEYKNGEDEYTCCLFEYEFGNNGERQYSDVEINKFSIALFYNNIERFYSSTFTSKAIELLKKYCYREEKLILSFITNLKLIS